MSTSFKLIGYPLEHRLYNGKNNAQDHISKGYKPQGVDNMTSNKPTTVDNIAVSTSSGSNFTPDKFSKILQLLDRDATPSTPIIPEVNMEGITNASS